MSLVNIHLASSTLLSNRTLYPYTFGILPPKALVVEAYLALFKYNNWTRAASLYNPLMVSDYTAYRLLEQKLKKTGVELSFTSEATTSYLPLDALKSTNVRVIVSFLRDDSIQRLLCIASHLKMVYPRYQWIFQFAPPNSANVSFTYGGTFYSCTAEQLTMVVQRSITFESTYASTHLTRVTNLTEVLLNSTCSPYHDCLAVFDAAWALALALNRSAAQEAGPMLLSNYRYGNSIFTEMVKQELEKVQFRGAVGDIRFSKDNGYVSNVQIVVKQYFDGYKTVGSLKPGADVSIDVNASIASFVLSSFNEVTVTIPLAMAVVVKVVNVAAVFLIAVIHVINTRYHEVNTIKASSPRLNHLAYMGCYIIVLASLVNTAMEAFLLGHGNLDTVMCNMFPWFVTLGFTLVFGTVMVKTGRLYFIFKSSLNLQRTSSVVARDYTLTFLVIAFALVGAILCTVWTVIDASVRIYVRKPTGTPDGNLEVRIKKGQCSSKYQLNFIVAIVAYLAVLIMCCVVLAISNRTITWKEFKSNGVILLVYMLVLTNGTCGAVYYVAWHAAFDNAIAYAMFSLMLAANVYLCIGLLFAPPVTPVFQQLWRDLHEKIIPGNLFKKQVEFSTTL